MVFKQRQKERATNTCAVNLLLVQPPTLLTLHNRQRRWWASGYQQWLSGFTINSAKVNAKGIIGNYAYTYYLQNLPQLKTYKTPGEFVKTFVLNEDSWKQFVTLAAKDSITLNTVTAKEKADLTNRISSYIARQLWRTEGMIEVLNVNDVTIKKALEVLGK